LQPRTRSKAVAFVGEDIQWMVGEVSSITAQNEAFSNIDGGKLCMTLSILG
jgi:hypothetical protein